MPQKSQIVFFPILISKLESYICATYDRSLSKLINKLSKEAFTVTENEMSLHRQTVGPSFIKQCCLLKINITWTNPETFK